MHLLHLSAGASILLSIAHTMVAFAGFRELSEEALWFAAAGLTLLLAALLNLSVWQLPARGKTLRGSTHLANLLLLGFGVAAVVILATPPAYAVALALGGLTVAGAQWESHFGGRVQHPRPTTRSPEPPPLGVA